MSLFQASQQWSTMSSKDLKISVREPVVAHELPGVFLRVQLRAFCRQWDERDVGRNGQAAGEIPAGLIDEQAACAPGAIWVAISARYRFMASLSHRGKTRAAPLPSLGRIAPKI